MTGGPRSPLLLGVDVGNSKTHVAIADTAGRVLGFAEGPGGSPQALGYPGTWRLVDDLVRQARRTADLPPDAGFAAAAHAVAGVDFPFEQDHLEAAADWRHAERHAVWNDTFAVLRAGTPGHRGIAVVAGAGMNCVGLAGDRSVRFPSLGRLSGDWGGGIVLGLEALSAACRDEDGRGPATRLRRDVTGHFGLGEPSEVTLAVHRRLLPESRLTELARLVLSGADHGDPVCERLVARQAHEVVALLRATAERLGVGLTDVPLLLGGGLLRAGCRTLDRGVAAGLSELHPDARAELAPGPPVVGAVLLAADLLRGTAPRPDDVARSLADLLAAGGAHGGGDL